jgi:hypothetical protein
MSKDDVLFGYRLRLFALAGEIGVPAACRARSRRRGPAASTHAVATRPRSAERWSPRSSPTVTSQRVTTR